MENEIIKSTKENLYSKITSPLWGTFIISWSIWNWRIIYTTLFVDDELIFTLYNKVKIDYITQNIMDGVLNYLIYWFIGPILSTILILWFIPYLSNLVYIRDISKFKKNRIIAKINMEKDIENEMIKKTKEENELLEQLLGGLDEKSEKLDKIEQKTQEINKKSEILLESDKNKELDQEYDIIIKKYDNIIKNLSDFMYIHHGSIDERNGEYFERNITSENEKIFDSLMIITEDGLDTGNRKKYKLTEKGKYFLKKDTLEKDKK